MTHKSAEERRLAVLESKRSYWKRRRVQLGKRAKKRYKEAQPADWIDRRTRAAQARVSEATIHMWTEDIEQREALLTIQAVQERVLRRTQGLLRRWCSAIAERMLGNDDEEAAKILRTEREWISEAFDQVTSALSYVCDSPDLYQLAIGMGAHTRDADSCLRDVQERLEGGGLLEAYVERQLYCDLYTT